MAGADVQGVGARVSRPDRNLLAFVPWQAAREIVLDRQPINHRHVADRRLDGAQHLKPKASPVFKAAAVLVDAPVLERRVELRDQIAMRGMDLDAIEAGAPGAPGGCCECRRRFGDPRMRHLLRHNGLERDLIDRVRNR